jgi:capsule polysaccharide export protein KpsE/RkpR
MCSAWADASESWATAIEPYISQMIHHNRKVKRLVVVGAKRKFSEAHLPNRIYDYAP